MATQKSSMGGTSGGRRTSVTAAAAGPKTARTAAVAPQQQQLNLSSVEPQPSLFDFFYEEFLTQLMNSGNLAERLPDEFMRHQTDIERVEYLTGLRPFIRDFEIPGKVGIKSLEKSTRYREEGNRLFQAEQATQAILFYNKALAYAPHPDHETYLSMGKGSGAAAVEEVRPIGAAAAAAEPRRRSPPSKYEALSFCYANRSAALRKLGQYDDCLKDVARAARFGYPRENIYKLWERKAKCYQGMRRYEMAVKCFRQAVQALKESTLSDNQKSLKSHEIQGWIRDLRTHVLQHGGTIAGGAAVDLGSFGDGGSDKGSDSGSAAAVDAAAGAMPMMGATGPIVIVPDPVPRRKASEAPAAPPSMVSEKLPSKPERHRSFRIKRSFRKEETKSAPSSSPLPTLPNGGGGDSSSLGGGSIKNDSNSSLNKSAGGVSLPSSAPATTTSVSSSVSWQSPAIGELQKARSNSQMSISQISTGGIKPEIEVPELSYGQNPRMPSASGAIDLRFTPDKGRYFVALQDLNPGDVILREEPYAAVLEAIFRVNHCAHCLKKIPTPIPCYECATVQYCGETCRDLSWSEYHRIECGILAYMEPSRYLGKMPHLAMRIITKTGMQNLIHHSMTPLMPTVKNHGEDHGAASPGGAHPDLSTIFDPHSYRSVHNLATNADKRPFEDLIKKTAVAIFMAKCLKFNGFFGGEKEHERAGTAAASASDTRRAEMFVSSLLLRHLQIASTNGLEMAECILKNGDVTKFDIIPVGGAIFPTMSFFNHSCYPNALRLGYQNFQVVRIIRSVQRGEEINIDYGFDFYANTREMRAKRSTSQYFFECQCVACRENWPVYSELTTGRTRQLKVKPSQALSEELGRQAAAYQIGMDFLLKLDIATALPIFRDYLMVMNELVVHPDSRYIDCEEAYKQCLWLENRGYKAKVATPTSPTSPSHQHQQQHHHPDAALRQASTSSTLR